MPPFESARILAALLADTPPKLPDDPAGRERLLELAEAEGLGPLVARRIRPFVADRERGRCDEILRKSWTRHDRMLSAVAQVAEAMEAGGVRALALKGPVLAARYYQPPFLRRPSGDLDIGVADADLERGCDVLTSLGYRLWRNLAKTRATSHHAILIQPEGSRLPLIDLHFRLTHGRLGIPIADLLDAAVPYQLPGGPETLVLDPADELLHLGLHSVYGRFNPFFHVFEFRRLWNASESVVRERAVRKAVDRHLAGGLRMVDVALRRIWGEQLVPDGALPRTWLDSRINERLLGDFERWTAETRRDGGPGSTLRSRVGGRLLDFQLTDRPVDGVRLGGAIFRLLLGF